MLSILRKLALAAALLCASPLHAQDRDEADRNDPSVIERERELREEPVRQPRPEVQVSPPRQGIVETPRQEVVAGAIRVVGATRVPTAAFAPAIEPFLGRPLDQGDLVRLASAVGDVMRRQGYGLATAWIPAQDMVGGVLAIQVDEGRIGSVRATGPAARLVEQRLGAVVLGRPMLTRELERQLLVVGDIGGLSVSDARLVREGDVNVLSVTTRYDRVHSTIRIDNWGTQSLGPLRASAEVGVNGLIAHGDELSLGLSTTPLDPDQVQFIDARYGVPVGGAGTMVSIGGYLGRTRSVGSETNDMFAGESSMLALEASHPLRRARRGSLWLTGRFQLRDSMLAREGNPLRDDRIVSAAASLYGVRRMAGGRVRARLSLVQGLDMLDATRRGDPLASRDDAGGVFTKLAFWGEYWRRLGGGFSLELAAASQIANRPLLLSEQMGLGGPQFLRAFDYRERSGDQGIAASAELRFDLRNIEQPVDSLQFYVYADGGRVSQLRSGERAADLASAGAGLRFRIARRFDVGAEAGFPIHNDDVFRGDDPRFSFSITTRF